MHINAPTFPLSRAAFAAALKTGHGRALQHVASHGVSGLEDELIGACISCMSYDSQCEGDRAPWLVSIIDRAQLHDKLVRAIAATKDVFRSENHDNLAQRCAILKELASMGAAEARRLLYASLARSSNTADVLGADHIVALDGEPGLLHVVRQLGQWLHADPDFWVDDRLIAQFDDATGSARGMDILEREAIVDVDIAHYLHAIRTTRDRQSGASRRLNVGDFTGAALIEYVRNHPRDACYWLRRWSAQADSGQCELVFDALLASSDSELVKRLFRCFSVTGVPRFDNRLLPWLTHADEQLAWAAGRAVAPVRHVELRQTAWRLINDGMLANGATLLVNNVEAGDLALCAARLVRLEDPDEAHHLAEALLDLCNAHPGSEALDCLLYVYEHSPCSICRQRAVEALSSTGLAPAWLLAESEFDAQPHTRLLAQGSRPAQQERS